MLLSLPFMMIGKAISWGSAILPKAVTTVATKVLPMISKVAKGVKLAKNVLPTKRDYTQSYPRNETKWVRGERDWAPDKSTEELYDNGVEVLQGIWGAAKQAFNFFGKRSANETQKRPGANTTIIIQNYVNSFQTRAYETVLFEFWEVNTFAGILFTCFLIIILCLLVETFKFVRCYRRIKYEKPVNRKDRMRCAPKADIGDFVLMILQLSLSSLIMLILITYDIAYCLSAGAGIVLSHFLYKTLFPHIYSTA